MIIVDINIKAIDKVYDFKLDDTAPIIKVIDEICDLVVRKEKYEPVKDPSNLLLIENSTGRILHHDKTLAQCGIMSGNKLILI